MTGRASTAVLLVLFVLVAAAAAPSTVEIESPTYRSGERWAYALQGDLPALLGFEGSNASISVQGEASLTPVAVEESSASLRWEADLSLAGTVELMDGGSSAEAEIAGSVRMTRVERYESLYFLPVEIRSTFPLDVDVAYGGFSLTYAASLEEVLLFTPASNFPEYPVEEGQRTLTVPARRWTNLTLPFDGGDNVTRTFAEVDSVLRINVSGGHPVQVPAGEFVASRVLLETLEGFSPGLLSTLLPNASEVAYYNHAVKGPLLVEYLVGKEKVGTVTLEIYVPPSEAPGWVRLLLLAGVLAVPAGVLAYRYWRERRRGL